jgi:dolichol-phosphate mannosyltransferase/undecaprenyl-phosphate 4-deoxy-4-formamido-L-arabinose transferase
MLVTVVVPVYNSPVLPELAMRIAAAFKGGADDHEIVFVDDGSSSPDVWPTLESLTLADPRVRAVQLTRNFGQHAATLCGLRESRGDVVVTMDDDLQHDPDDIPRFLALRGHDIVIAQFTRREQGGLRRWTSWGKSVVDRFVVDKPRGIRLASFRMLSRPVVDGMLTIRAVRPYIPALMLHVSRDVVGVPVRHQARATGHSGYTVAKLVRLFGTLLFSNPSFALRLVGCLGVLCTVGGLLSAALVLARPDFTSAGSGVGWPVFIATELVIGGALLLGLGAIGEHLIRALAGTEERPPYLIRRRAGGGDSSRGPTPLD